MPTEFYRFDAHEGSVLYANDREYGPGEIVELPVGQTDPRLTRVEEGDLEAEDDRGLSDVVQDETDSIDEAEEAAEETVEETPDDAGADAAEIEDADSAGGFGNPRPKRAGK